MPLANWAMASGGCVSKRFTISSSNAFASGDPNGASTAGNNIILRFGDNRHYSFHRENVLVRGRWGNLYKATVVEQHEDTDNKWVAMKEVILGPEFDSEHRSFNRLKLLAALARWSLLFFLDHENLVKYYQCTLKQSPHGIVVQLAMKYCPDSSLADLIDNFRSSERTMPLKMVLDHAKQMATGLAFLYEHGIVHLDVQPRHLLVTRPTANVNKLQICDIDAATILSRGTMEELIRGPFGSPSYMAPEMVGCVFLNDATFSSGWKSSIWSAGCVIHDLALCCTGEKEKWFQSRNGTERYRYDEMSELQFLEKIKDGHIPYIGDPIPKDLARRIMDGCFAMRPDERFTAVELINKLVDIEQHTYGTTLNQTATSSRTQYAVEKLQLHCLNNEELGVSDCRYEFNWKDAVIGQGGFGTVYKAKITQWGTYSGNASVAVKETTLSVDTVRQWKKDGSLEKVKDVWRSLVTLRHEYLVSHYKVTISRLVAGTGVEFMMDYCEGGSLYDMIKEYCRSNRSLSTEVLLKYAVQMATGLKYLHLHHIVHGDLKPSNIFLKLQPDGEQCVMIGDFDGSVRLEQGTTACSRERMALHGTIPYMSPEMVMMTLQEPHEPIRYSTDIWSLGCVILDMADCCCGIKERWYVKRSLTVTEESSMDKIQRENYESFSFLLKLSKGYVPYISDQIPDYLAGICTSCFVPDPLGRISIDHLLKRLEHKEQKQPQRRVTLREAFRNARQRVKNRLRLTCPTIRIPFGRTFFSNKLSRP